jgi:hypothetical protein
METARTDLARALLADAEEGGSSLPPVAGLRTLLEKAELEARYPEAVRCCVELGVTKLVDLGIDSVREELSRNVRLAFVEKEKLKVECADVAKLRAYALSASGQPPSNDSGQSSSAQEGRSRALLGIADSVPVAPAGPTSTGTLGKRQRPDSAHNAADSCSSHTLTFSC